MSDKIEFDNGHSNNSNWNQSNFVIKSSSLGPDSDSIGVVSSTYNSTDQLTNLNQNMSNIHLNDVCIGKKFFTCSF